MHERIKEIRKALNLNQVDFAEKIGLSQSSLGMIEVGKRTFSEKHIKLICTTFNVNENWLRTGDGNMFSSTPYERQLLNVFDSLTKSSQEYLLAVAEGLLKNEEILLKKREQ